MSLADGVAVTVPVALIRPNSWNPNVQAAWMFEKELESIRRYGFVDPLIVRHADGWAVKATYGYYEIIDGEHRLKAAAQLGYTELPCWNLGVVDDNDARELTVVLNETKGQPDQARLRELLTDLVARRGGDNELREVMPFSRDRFNELIGSVEVDWAALEERRKQIQSQGRWKELVFRLPYESAAVIEQAISQVKDQEGIDESWRALEMICADFVAGTGISAQRKN